jgi:sec-independent protein translocase protein TatA
MGDIGLPELLVIFAIALLIFGPRKIGELGKGLGEGIRGFKSALSGEDKAAPSGQSESSDAKQEAEKETPVETRQP